MPHGVPLLKEATDRWLVEIGLKAKRWWRRRLKTGAFPRRPRCSHCARISSVQGKPDSAGLSISIFLRSRREERPSHDLAIWRAMSRAPS